MGAAGTHWRKVSLRRTSRWEASKANSSFSRQRPSCQEPVGACGGDGRLRPSPRRNGLFCEQTAGDLKLLLSAQRGHSVSSYLSPLGHLGASLHLSLLPGSPQSGPLRAPLTQLSALRGAGQDLPPPASGLPLLCGGKGEGTPPSIRGPGSMASAREVWGGAGRSDSPGSQGWE